MTELLTAAQMRAIEAAAIASGQVTGLDLMERAGAGVVEAIFEDWPALRATSHRAVVLCGPGNNGGDGFVVARLLKEWGWEVEVFLYGTPEGMPPDARVNYERWVAIGEVRGLEMSAFYASPAADIYVDAVFGTGLSRPPEGEIAEVLAYVGGLGGDIGHFAPRLLAINSPSGLCLDSGRMLLDGWATPQARLTVTFHRAKAGHYLDIGPKSCGRVHVVDIGIPPWRRMFPPRRENRKVVVPQEIVRLGLVEPLNDLSSPIRGPGAIKTGMLGKAGWTEAHEAHKFSHGHALILSGPPGHGGAARMTARGALRIGAGLVTLACPPTQSQKTPVALTPSC